MISIGSILAPTDLTPHSESAVKYACSLAVQFGSTLHLLHVLPELTPVGPDPSAMPIAVPPDYYAESEEAAQQRLGEVIGPDWDRPQSVQLATRWGGAVEGILSYAADQKIDLLVIATHGRTGLSHLLSGSAAEQIVRESLCPVLTIRDQSD